MIYKTLEEKSIFWIIDDYFLIKISGYDAQTYLNSQTTNDTINLDNNKGIDNNLVDRKGKLISPFSLHKIDNYMISISQEAPGISLIEHLEKYHFNEDLFIENISNNFKLISIQGFLSSNIINEIFSVYLENENDIFYLNENYIIKKTLSYEEGYLLLIQNNNFENIINKLKEISYQVNKNELEKIRILSGILLYGKDINSDNIVSETGRELFSINYSKGCYLGQEVISRIKSYGVIANALIGLEIEYSGIVPLSNSKIIINNKEIGKIKSLILLEEENRVFAFAYLYKDFRLPNEKIEFISENNKFVATIRLLPFRKKLSKEEKAKKLYDDALSLFAENKEEISIHLLRKSIHLNPNFPDAYEALGVILSRIDKYKEAIEIMNKLLEVNPNEAMARTNLSIFYMKIGNKEEAERQMALATTLKFKKMMLENQEKLKNEEYDRKRIEEIKERIEMFKEVLETEDSNDLIANYGMAKSLFDLENYKEAIIYFKKAIDIKKDYSIAYLYLGRSYEFLNDLEDALLIYKKGIIVSSQKGDLMPLKEMESKIVKLENKEDGKYIKG